MTEYNDIWEILAYRIAKRISVEMKKPMSIELIEKIKDELRIFNEENVVQIYMKLPDQKEIDAIYHDVMRLRRKAGI